jgi:hypothetical protein
MLKSLRATLDVYVSVTVEEGYGTRMLPSGDIRIDCRESPDRVWKIIDEKVLCVWFMIPQCLIGSIFVIALIVIRL